jgi:hypothetical protein
VLYTRPLYICGIVWLNISYNEKRFETIFQRKLKHTFFVQNIISENVLHFSSLKTHFDSTVLDYVIVLKVKQSHYRPGQALRVPGGWGSQILRQSAHESGKVVSHTHRPLYPKEILLLHIFVRGIESVRGIEFVTFRLVEKCLHQLCHHVPQVSELSLTYFQTFIFPSNRSVYLQNSELQAVSVCLSVFPQEIILVLISVSFFNLRAIMRPKVYVIENSQWHQRESNPRNYGW